MSLASQLAILEGATPVISSILRESGDLLLAAKVLRISFLLLESVRGEVRKNVWSGWMDANGYRSHQKPSSQPKPSFKQ